MNLVNVGYDSANYYVLEQNNLCILVDAGWPGTLPKLIHGLQRKGLALADLKYLLITHYHPDHAGLVQELKEKGLQHIVLDEQLAAVPVLGRYMKPDSGYQAVELAGSIQFPAAESRSWLERVGYQGEIVSTPGHSDDSISLVLDGGIALTGDLMLPELAAESQREIVAHSWNKLLELNVQTVYPGHGPARQLFR